MVGSGPGGRNMPGIHEEEKQMQPSARWKGRYRPITRIVAAGVLLAGLSEAALADDASVERGRKIFDGKGGCSFCHGWAGDGQGDPRSEGGAPSLRVSFLDRDQVREVIQCGRPATPMPHSDRFAYTDDRCYGMTAADLEGDTPPRALKTLQPHEINALADYVSVKIVGAGPVTFEQCVEFFGSVVKACGNYPTESGEEPDMTGAKPTPVNAANMGGEH